VAHEVALLGQCRNVLVEQHLALTIGSAYHNTGLDKVCTYGCDLVDEFPPGYRRTDGPAILAEADNSLLFRRSSTQELSSAPRIPRWEQAFPDS
jgi:hypothetical protein